jgi:hypothetical protein
MRLRVSLLLAAGIACTPRQLALAPELAGAPALQPRITRRAVDGLSGRSAGTLALGSQLLTWQRATGRMEAGAPGPGSQCESEGAFSFSLPPARPVKCSERMKGTRGIGVANAEIGVKELELEHHVQCAGVGAALELSDAGAAHGHLRGTASLDGIALALESTFPPGSGWELPWGFTLRDAQGRAVAAVQVQDPKQVWLAPQLAPALRSAVLFATSVVLLKSTGTEGCPPRSR